MSERWMARAACKGLDARIFFPERGMPATEAREVCAGCPVCAECLTYALGAGATEHGILAGLTPRERLHLRAELRRDQPKVAPDTGVSRGQPAGAFPRLTAPASIEPAWTRAQLLEVRAAEG